MERRFILLCFLLLFFSNSAIFQLEGEVIRLEGIPGVAIISKAREVNASMIVIGSRGFGRIRRTLMGSVSNFVVHHSPVPVALCKYEKRATEVPWMCLDHLIFLVLTYIEFIYWMNKYDQIDLSVYSRLWFIPIYNFLQ